MIVRSIAPLRIGLAGGGTDVSPYSELYGGAVLNATISLFARATLEPTDDNQIELIASDRNEAARFPVMNQLPVNGKLDLLKGVYNRFKKDHQLPAGGLRISTTVDVPAGSGLGTSSTLVVALVGAFDHLLKLNMSREDIAAYAYKIERHDLLWAGGKQDQYAAAFGGFNFMEFKNNSVTVSPLALPAKEIQSLQDSLLLYYTDSVRDSADIIRRQAQNVIEQHSSSIEAMHQLKREALSMRTILEAGRTDQLGQMLHKGFEYKRQMASGISTPFLEELYQAAIAAGATGGKISGAGGGGFLIFYAPPAVKENVTRALHKYPGQWTSYHFVDKGLQCFSEQASLNNHLIQ